jgi:hypothetical protein
MDRLQCGQLQGQVKEQVPRGSCQQHVDIVLASFRAGLKYDMSNK